MKNFYYAVLTENEEGKQLSCALRVSQYENLLHALNQIENVVAVTACESKKRALEITESWNRIAQDQNRYLYGDWQKYDFILG